VADETNITPGAGARPGTSTEGGYAVFHLNDALHATAPIYIRFGFGTGTSATAPRVQVTVGTSTNGSGVLGGTALTATTGIGPNGATATVDTVRQSWFSANEGFVGLFWKQGFSGVGALFICRTCDADGEPDARGAVVNWGNASSGTINGRQALRFASPAEAFTSQTSITGCMFGFFPAGPQGDSVIDSDLQAALAWTAVPEASPLFGLCGLLVGTGAIPEVSLGTTFSIAMVGSTPRTFIALNGEAGPFGPATAGTAGQPFFAMLWE
jgi:hypothetical protein